MKKCLAIGIIVLFIGTNIIPTSNGNSSQKDDSILQMNRSIPSNVTITDTLGDVCTLNVTTQETTIVTYHPDIDVVNLDIVQATYTQQGTQATLSVQVVGIIEDRGQLIDLYEGNFSDLNFVEYDFQLITSERYYAIQYANQTGRLRYGMELINLTSSDFSVVGDTLSIWFSLLNANETYVDLRLSSMFVKMNISSWNLSEFVYLADLAPNLPLEIMDPFAPPTGYEGQTIQFKGNVMSFSGLPPYTYQWDFGDGSTSTQHNPTHIYTEEGFYTYTLTVTDNASATASRSDRIIIRDVKKAFIVGSFKNFSTEDDYFILTTVDLRLMAFKPFQFSHYIDGEEITVLKDTVTMLITKRFIIGVVDYVVGMEEDEYGEIIIPSNLVIPINMGTNPYQFFKQIKR